MDEIVKKFAQLSTPIEEKVSCYPINTINIPNISLTMLLLENTHQLMKN